jgi:hypothetical protein
VEVGQQQVAVALQQRIHQGAVATGLAGREVALGDGVDHAAQHPAFLVVQARVVAQCAQLADLLGLQAEDEEVLATDGLGHLDVGAVPGADGECAVEGELHVAGARGLGAGGGDLLGEIGRGDDGLGQRDAVVGQEDELEPVAHARVAVDHPGDVVRQADDVLGRHIGRGRLARHEHGAGTQSACGSARMAW